MGCPLRDKREKRILFWKYEVEMPHEWDILEVGVFMKYVSNHFTVIKTCRHCGKWNKNHFVEHETLIALGYSKDDLDKALTHEVR